MADQKKKEKRCFVICPIGENGTEIRARSNDIFDHLVRPIAEAAGYVAHRVIDNDRPGDITSKIIGDILSADAIVADITGHNPNVFYELAIAHAWKKPCILLSGDDPLRVPFDIASQNVISLRTESFGAFETTKKLVAKHFADIADGKAGLENPVARFERGKELEKSGNPLAAEVAELREEVAGLKARKRGTVRTISPFEALTFTEEEMRSIRDHNGRFVQMPLPGGPWQSGEGDKGEQD